MKSNRLLFTSFLITLFYEETFQKCQTFVGERSNFLRCYDDIPSIKNYCNESRETIEMHSIKFDEISKCLQTFMNTDTKHLRNFTIIDSKIDFFLGHISENFSNLCHLQLNHNNLTNVSTGLFRNLLQLEILDLSYNKLTTIEKDTFINLPKLKKLYISNNKLAFLNYTFNNLNNLTKVYANNNNELSNFHPHLFRKVNENDCETRLILETLDFSHNNLTVIEENTFSCLFQLKELRLNNNKLKHLNISFARQNRPFLLDISDNHLTDISLNANVEYLYLRNNRIKNITFQNQQINHIDISRNALEIVENLPIYVEHLDLNSNNLSNTDFLKNIQLDHLHTLDISFNNVKKVNFELSSLKNLLYLNATNNVIEFISIETFANMSSLRKLNLSHNSISILKTGIFAGLRQLRIIDLSHNKLISLNEITFHPLQSLEYLFVDNNLLTTIDVSVLTSVTRELWQISIFNNAWNCNTLWQILKDMKIYQIKANVGKEYKTSNIEGISCQDQGIDNIIIQKPVNNKNEEMQQNLYLDKSIDTKVKEHLSGVSFSGIHTMLIILIILLLLVVVCLILLLYVSIFKILRSRKAFVNKNYESSLYVSNETKLVS